MKLGRFDQGMHIVQKRNNGMQTQNLFQVTKETQIFISNVAPFTYYHALLQSNVDIAP
jgi:hypothetical protein